MLMIQWKGLQDGEGVQLRSAVVRVIALGPELLTAEDDRRAVEAFMEQL